jgi:hypothetical protein
MLHFSPILLGIMGIYTNVENTKKYENGSEVLVEVIDKPNDCESINSRSTFIKIQYNGLTIPKKIGTGYCVNLNNDFIKMRLTPDGKYLFFLNEKDDFPQQIGASSMILIIGIIILLISLRKNTDGNSR